MFRANDEATGRSAILKVLRPDVAGSPDGTRFLQELEALLRLDHPNVVRLLDHGWTREGELCLAMEEVPGRSLFELLQARGRLSVAETLVVGRGLLEGLSHLHGLGLAHRDVSPGNLIVSSSLGATLIDLGLALLPERSTERSFERLTQGGLVIGTPAYMAPERALGEKGDARSDVYSAGLVLYECLTGQPVFTAEKDVDYLALQLNVLPPAVSTRVPSVPPAIDRAVSRALQKAPERRHQSAREFLEALLQTHSADVGSLLGNWLLEERLGSGGMGAVFRAKHTVSGAVAALKVLRPVSDDPDGIFKRFRREVQALARLEHPAIVRVLEESLDHSPPFFCMELLPGGSLASRIERDCNQASPGTPSFDPDWLAELAYQVAQGLAVVHAANILHRDIKPANILLTADGQPKLCDFGLAKLQDVTALTVPNQVMGTVPFLAPETLRGEGFTERSELYQLGVTLFQAATGHPPYTMEQLLGVISRRPLPPPPELTCLAPALAKRLPWFPAMLERLMLESPAARFQSASGLVAHIEGQRSPPDPGRIAVAATPASASEAPPPRKAGSAQRRRPAVVEPGGVAAGPERRRPPPRWVLGVSTALWVLGVMALAWWRLGPGGVEHAAGDGSRRQPQVATTSSPGQRTEQRHLAAPRVTVGATSVHLWLDEPAPNDARLSFWPEGSSSGRTEMLRSSVPDLLLGGLMPGTGYEGRMLADGFETPIAFRTLRKCPVPGGMLLLQEDDKVSEPKLKAAGKHVVALWRRVARPEQTCRVEVSQSRDGGLTWSPPEVLASSRGTLFSLALAVGPLDAVAGWREGEPGRSDGQVCVRRWEPVRRAWGATLRAQVGRSLGGLGLVLSEDRVDLLAVIDASATAGQRALGHSILSSEVSVLPRFQPIVSLPAGTAGNLKLALREDTLLVAIDQRRGDRSWDLVWTWGKLGLPLPWRPAQSLVNPDDDVGKFDVATLGDAFVVLYQTGGQFFTRVITGRDATPSPRDRLVADELLVNSGVLVVRDSRCYLAYLACPTPVRPVGALRLFRSLDGRSWDGLPGVDLRGNIPLQAQLAFSDRRLLALIAGEIDNLTLCPVPVPDSP